VRRTSLAALCVAGIVGLAGQASATVFTVDETVDVNSGPYDGSSQYVFGSGAFSALAPITLGVGDELDLTISFQPGQTLHLINVNKVIAILGGAGGAGLTSDSPTLTFLGAGGAPFGSATIPHTLLPVIGVPAEGGYSGPQTISGLRFVVPISALTGGNGTTATYSSIQSLRITDFGIGGAVMTEPASWAMLIGGFGMAGASLRRRRAQPA
jgi:hypothetical protein